MLTNEVILKNSAEINKINDFVNHKTGNGNNVFVCMIGENSTYLNDIMNMDNILCRSTAYNRIDALPMLPLDDIGYYDNAYNDWIRRFKKKAVTRASLNNERQSEALGEALIQTLNVFIKVRKQITDSIEKNFVMKLLFWYDFVMNNLINNNYLSNGIKVVGENIAKLQDYLFFYMLVLTGVDVLLLQNKADVDSQAKRLELSVRVVLGHLGNTDNPKFTRILTEQSTVTRLTNPPSGGNIKVTIPPRQGRKNTAEQPAAVQSERNIRVTIPPRQSRQNTVIKSTNSDQFKPQHRYRDGQKKNSVQKPRIERNYEELAQLASSVVQIFIARKKAFAMSMDDLEIVGNGSGIMIADDGYILTNFHVAKESSEYLVRIENDDNVYFSNKLIKYHRDFDLAIIKIDRKLSPLPIYSNPKPLVRGQRVVAIGSPKGMFNTVSDGIISGFRTINDVDMIQFTAPISNGSSGGALLNMYGEVIGISTSGIDEAQNINFAIGYENILNFCRGITAQFGI